MLAPYKGLRVYLKILGNRKVNNKVPFGLIAILCSFRDSIDLLDEPRYKTLRPDESIVLPKLFSHGVRLN